MPKAKVKTAEPPAATNGHRHPDEFRVVPIADLIASASNPRKVFHQKPLDELTASIKVHGILEPLIVRLVPLDNETLDDRKYEIVAGERRFRAANKAGLTEVPCIVKDLDADQVFDIQIDENWQRNDLEPMDEARAIKFVKESGKLSLEELAARLSKDIRFIHARLKLNDLLPEFQKALDKGTLPVTQAQVIARYPEDRQKVILKECFYGSVNWEMTLSDLQERISRYVEMELSKAPFDLEDDRLRKDGLKCGDCKERAGANPTLFEKVKPNEDRCLNQACFNNKCQAFVAVGRDDLTAKGKKKFGPEYEAAIVLSYYGYDNKTLPAGVIPAAAFRYYDSWEYDKSQKCTGKEKAISLDYNGWPGFKDICRDKSCPRHWKKARGSSSGTDKSDPVERARRKEEIFDAKVREVVRQKVLHEAAPKFAEQFTVQSSEPSLLLDLSERVWDRFNDEQVDNRFIQPAVKRFTGKPMPSVYSREARAKWLCENLSEIQRAELLFLGVYGVKGTMLYGDRYHSQAEIMAIANRYGINYRLYDAEERLVQCKNKKLRALLEPYLEKVRGGEPAEIPRFWKPDYVAVDEPPEADPDDIDDTEYWPEDDENEE